MPIGANAGVQENLFVPSLKVIEMRTDKTDQTVSNTSKDDAPNTARGPVMIPATLGALRAAAMRLADTRKKPKMKTRDLVGMLLSHGARTWRSSLPVVRVKLAVKSPDGMTAVRIGYRATPKTFTLS